MPIARILDITVDKPILGRILGYGHFTFESAAQEQGIREIRYIGRPDERDLTIQWWSSGPVCGDGHRQPRRGRRER